MFGSNETIDKLAMANSVCRWYVHVLRREDGHALRRTLDFEVEGRRKGSRRRHGGKCEGWFEKGRCTLPIKV